MTDNLPPEPEPLWAYLEAHLNCARTCQAAAQGWLIEGVSVTFSVERPKIRRTAVARPGTHPL